MSGWAVKVSKLMVSSGDSGEVVEALWDAYVEDKDEAVKLVRQESNATPDERVEAVEELSNVTLTELGFTPGRTKRRPYD